ALECRQPTATADQSESASAIAAVAAATAAADAEVIWKLGQGWRRGAGRTLPALALLGAILTAPAFAGGKEHWPKLHTNEQYLEELQQGGGLDIADLRAVFAFVFGSLDDEVTVYPTENYYYFSFFHRGVPYQGNIRLATVDRDEGVLHFAYFPAGSAAI